MARIRRVVPARSARTAFTLIEMLLVIVIVGALLAVAIPNVGRQVSRDRTNRAASVILGMLDEASQLAVRRRSPVTVTLSSGTLFVRDRATNAILKQRTFSTNDLRATVVIRPTTGITIFPNGRANAALSVSVTGGGESALVTRTATGILRRN